MDNWLRKGLWFAGIYGVLLSLMIFSGGGLMAMIIMPGYWLYELYTNIVGYGIKMNAELKIFLYFAVSVLIVFFVGAFFGWIKKDKNFQQKAS